MRIGSWISEVKLVNNHESIQAVDPIDLLALPDDKGKMKRKEVFAFMESVTERVNEIVENKRFGLVDKVWVVPFDKIGDTTSQGGILMSLGVIETGENEVSGFPYTPVVTMIPMDDFESLDIRWKDLNQEEQSLAMLKLVKQRMAEPNAEGKEILGGSGSAVIGIHGWTGNPFVWWRQVRHFASVTDKPEDMKKAVFFSLGVQGALKSGRGSSQEKSMEMVPDQVENTLVRICGELAGDSGDKRDNFWKRVGVVFGHSMGGWVVSRLINGNFKKYLERVGNYETRFIVMDPVIHGIKLNEHEKVIAKEVLGIKKFKGFVSLLESDVRGVITSSADLLMKSKISGPVARKLAILRLLVRSYMGKNREWEGSLHEYTVGTDTWMTAANSKMLRNASLIIKDFKELMFMQQLADSGKLWWGLGEIDKILQVNNQKIVANAVRVDPQNLIQSVEHYPKFDFFTTVAEALGDFNYFNKFINRPLTNTK